MVHSRCCTQPRDTEHNSALVLLNYLKDRLKAR